MSQIRCLLCGSAQWDSNGYKCGLCGGAMGMRHERCCVSEETSKKLHEHAKELAKYGIKLEQRQGLQKNAEPLGTVITRAGAFRPGALQLLVLYLNDNLLIPDDEILKLRLGEPEEILIYCRTGFKKTGLT